MALHRPAYHSTLNRFNKHSLNISTQILEKSTMSSTQVRPLEDRVLVKPLEAETKTASGLFLPETAKEKPQEGKVIAIGTGKRDDNGKLIPFEVKKGDRVLISKYGGTEIKVDGKDYLIMREDDILGVIE